MCLTYHLYLFSCVSLTCDSLFLVSHQVEACRLYSKFSARPSSLEMIPAVVEKVNCVLRPHEIKNSSFVACSTCLSALRPSIWYNKKVYIHFSRYTFLKFAFLALPYVCQTFNVFLKLNAPNVRRNIQFTMFCLCFLGCKEQHLWPPRSLLHRHSWRHGERQNRPDQCQVSFM